MIHLIYFNHIMVQITYHIQNPGYNLFKADIHTELITQQQVWLDLGTLSE